MSSDLLACDAGGTMSDRFHPERPGRPLLDERKSAGETLEKIAKWSE
jgi:hypothetical protein